jgi:hypothetical protein
VKTAPESPSLDRLIDAVLADDDWHALKANLHTQALGALAAARRKRQRRSRLLQGVVGAMLLAAFGWTLTSPVSFRSPAIRSTTLSAGPGPAPVPAASSYISEAEMLAMFPAGSCVVAEIDGQKEVIFLDPQIAANGVATVTVAAVRH